HLSVAHGYVVGGDSRDVCCRIGATLPRRKATADIRTISLLMAEGIALKGAESFEPAATKFRQVLARNPFHLAATESLAESLQKLGYTDEESYMRRAIQLKDNDLARTS
ncbi:MAG: hypothetical protein SGI77_19065, partial [Pirellulaceae bacterium]|nr:hypothetical protein [Pirellulaceae bacterium]